MPYHFIEPLLYAQFSHRLPALNLRLHAGKKLVKKRVETEESYGASSQHLLQENADPLRVRFWRVISGEVAVGIALADRERSSNPLRDFLGP
jgi:hypothetical protein